MDPTTIGAAIAAGKQALDFIKGARELASSGETVQLQERLASALQALTEVLYRQGELIVEINKAGQRLQELETELNLKRAMRFEYSVYWSARDDDSWDGPFSPFDYDKDHILIRMYPYKAMDPKFLIFKHPADRKVATAVPIDFVREKKVLSEISLERILRNE